MLWKSSVCPALNPTWWAIVNELLTYLHPIIYLFENLGGYTQHSVTINLGKKNSRPEHSIEWRKHQSSER